MDSKEIRSLWEAYASVYAPQEVEEGVRDVDPEKGTAERKARLEKKRGMKVDDHPQYKKEEVEGVDEAMRPGERQRKLAAKRHDPYATSRDRATAHNVAVRNDGPGTPGYEKKSTGGKGARYAGYGDQGAGNKARRRMGQEPLRGNTRKEELDTFDIVFEILDEEIENALEVMSQLTPDEVQEIAEGDLAAKARAKAVEMGRKRRSSKEYKQGGARGTGKNERAAYNLANKQNTPDADLGRQKEVDRSSGIGGHMKKALAKKGKYNYRAVLDKRDPKKNPKHTANQ